MFAINVKKSKENMSQQFGVRDVKWLLVPFVMALTSNENNFRSEPQDSSISGLQKDTIHELLGSENQV